MRVLEAADASAAACATEELTLPGFAHDVCSAIHPLGVASPFFRTVPLAEHGVEWIQSPAALAHPFDDGPPRCSSARSRRRERRSAPTRAATRGCSARSSRDCDAARPGHPRAARHAVASARARAVRRARPALPATRARAARVPRAARPRRSSRAWPRTRCCRSRSRATAAFGLMLGMLGHAVGWPFPRGGSQSSPTRSSRYLRSLGGEIETGTRVESLAELADAQRGPARRHAAPARSRSPATRCPSGTAAGSRGSATGPACSRSTGRSTARSRGGAGVRARRDGPPRRHARGDRRRRARAVARRASRERPYVLLAQPSLFDPTRAPEGKHTAWAYCHVPNGSTVDMTERIEAQVERFAPGFRDRIIAPLDARPRRSSRRTTRTTSAATSTAAPPTCGSCSPARSRGASHYTTPLPASSSARPRPRPAAASTACAAGTRRAPALRYSS